MQPVIQVGVTPLNEIQMLAVVSTVDTFLEEIRAEGPIRFDRLVGAMHDPDTDWSLDVGRLPTQLEIMAACCLLETRKLLSFDFIEGLLHVVSIPCNEPTK